MGTGGRRLPNARFRDTPRSPAVDQFVEVLRQYGFLFTILGGVVTALGVVFAIYKASHDKQVRFLNQRIHSLTQELAAAKSAGDPLILKEQNARLLQENGHLQNQLGAVTADRKALEGQCDLLRAECEAATRRGQQEQVAAQQRIDALSGELEKQQETLAERDRNDRRSKKLVKHALRLEGRIWQRKALRTIPSFRPLHERHAAIISVVNLKGGVGKTMVTAQL